MGTNRGTYREEPPDDYDGGQKEWNSLSYDMQYYYHNKNRQNYLKNKAQTINDRNRKYVDDIKRDSCCKECGEDHPATLDFHHQDGEKTGNVSDLVKDEYSIERIQEEIDKCIILCSNCHRKHHYGERFK